MGRLAIGVAYDGGRYRGWQTQAARGQAGGDAVPTVQAAVEAALSTFADAPVAVVCAGRTDAGVHALNQVIHLDAPVEREPFSWLRGGNRYLPADIGFQWCQPVGDDFHARFSAEGRSYRYLLLESALRPALEAGRVGWSFRALDGDRMREAAGLLLGEHDFSSFRAAECQARTPVKTLRRLDVSRRGAYWRFDFEADAFLHHMVRNLMGCLVAVGAGERPPGWVTKVLAARSRDAAAPTFAAAGLYFAGPSYAARHAIPSQTPAMAWMP